MLKAASFLLPIDTRRHVIDLLKLKFRHVEGLTLVLEHPDEPIIIDTNFLGASRNRF
jgi:hypothetical protein